MGQQTAESGTARKEANRRLADEGLSIREIAERTGHPKSTVARDLQGYERPVPIPDSDDRQRAKQLKAHADHLVKFQ